MAAEQRRRPILEHGVEAIAALMLAIMVVLVFANVVLRYGFNSGIAVSEELSRFIFVWLVFLGAILAARRREHLGMDSFRNLFGPLGRRALDMISEAMMAVLSALFLYGAVRMAAINADNALPITGLPTWTIYAAGILSGAGIMLISILHFIQHLSGREVEVEQHEHLFRE